MTRKRKFKTRPVRDAMMPVRDEQGRFTRERLEYFSPSPPARGPVVRFFNWLSKWLSSPKS